MLTSRYARPAMSALWADAAKYEFWLEIETAAAEAMGEFGLVPVEVGEQLRAHGKIDPARIAEIELVTRHDVIAFLTNLAESLGPESRYVHQGMTSSDVLDTCLALQLRRASDMLLEGMDGLLAALRLRANEHKYTPTIGRSHGIHAEPTSFGLKLVGFYAAVARGRERLVQARAEISTCMVSGAVGNFVHLAPEIEQRIAEKLGLTAELVSTQVIPRDRHAWFFAAIGNIASIIELIATEVRHLQRSEVREAEEKFHTGQKGSSAMPHKRNPVLTENLTGLARLIRATVAPAMENVALWHERDISHSSVERIIAPQGCILLDFALHRLTGVIENLVVYPDSMRRNLDLFHGVHHSQTVMLALTQAGMSREDAYREVQGAAMRCWEQGEDFLGILLESSVITGTLGEEKLREMCTDDHYMRSVDKVFARALK